MSQRQLTTAEHRAVAALHRVDIHVAHAFWPHLVESEEPLSDELCELIAQRIDRGEEDMPGR